MDAHMCKIQLDVWTLCYHSIATHISSMAGFTLDVLEKIDNGSIICWMHEMYTFENNKPLGENAIYDIDLSRLEKCLWVCNTKWHSWKIAPFKRLIVRYMRRCFINQVNCSKIRTCTNVYSNVLSIVVCDT